jgi:hypothetical protein
MKPFTHFPKTGNYKELKGFKEVKPFELYPTLVGKNIDNFYGMMDESGNEIVPFVYDDITTFLGVNEFVVKKDNKFGVTNDKNEPLTEIVYDKFFRIKKASDLPKEKKQNSSILQSKKTEVLLINLFDVLYDKKQA